MIENITNFTFNHSDQPDDLYKLMTATQVKEAFDSRGNELKNKINEVITQSNTNETDIENVRDSVKYIVLGQIPDDTITESKMALDMKKDIEGGITSYDNFTNKMLNKAEKQVLQDFMDSKSNPNGIASLGENGKVPFSELPYIESMTLIANVSPSNGNVVTFDNIPQDYKKLILEIKGYVQHASAKSDSIKLMVNGLNTSIYDYGFISNTKVSGNPTLTNNINQNMGYVGLGNGIATSYSNSSTSIFNITFENYKDLINYIQFNAFTQQDYDICYQNVGNARIRSQVPITKIDVLLNTATFNSNCNFKLYGVK